MCSGLINHVSLSGSLMPGERNLQECTVPAVTLGGGGIMVWCCISFSVFELIPLVLVKNNVNAKAHKDNYMLSSLWQQYSKEPFLFQHDCATVRKTISIKARFDKSGVEERI